MTPEQGSSIDQVRPASRDAAGGLQPAELPGADSRPAVRVRASHRRVAGRLTRLAPAIALFLLGPLFFHRMVTPGWAAVDYDLVNYFAPNRGYLAAAWANGRWIPLWNPKIYLGAPFLGNIQTAALYPPNLLMAGTPTEVGISWLLALHLGLAGAGMYLYGLLGLRLRRTGSAVTGLVYMLGEVMISQTGHLNQTNTLAWTPWLMLAADRAAARPRAGRLAAVAVLVALVILAGHAQQAYYTFLLATIAAGIRLWGITVHRRQLRRAARNVVLLAAGVGLGVGLSALQLAATYDLIRQSNRSAGLPLAQASSVSLPVRGVLGNLLPDYTADHPAEYAGSIGAAALFLICLALVARWRRPGVALWTLLGVVAVVTAFGPRAHLYDVFYQALPGMRLFRAPARLLIFATVAGAVLAGQGALTAQQLAVAWRRPRWRARVTRTLAGAGVLAVLPGTALLAVFMAHDPQRGVLRAFPVAVAPENVALLIALPMAVLLVIGVGLQLGRGARSALLGAMLPVLVLGDLALLEAHSYPLHPLPASLYHTRPAARALVASDPNSRYLSIVPYYNDLPAGGRVPAGLDSADAVTYLAYLRMIDPMVPDNGMQSGPLDADGYDGGLLPTQAYVDFRIPLLPPDTTNPPDFTDRLLTDRVWHQEWLREAGVGAVITAQGQDPNPPDCPHCLVPGASAGGMEVWHMAGAPVTRAHLDSGQAARIVQDTGEKVVVELPSGASGRLVLADSYYPGWVAEVDGHPASIERYEGYIRAVPIPTGAREVTFTYQPRWFAPGLAVSLACLSGVLLLSLWALVVGRRSRVA